LCAGVSSALTTVAKLGASPARSRTVSTMSRGALVATARGMRRASARVSATALGSYIGHDALRADIDNLKAALDQTERPVEAFMNAASPGISRDYLPTATTAARRPTSAPWPTR
jgi:hypothetical protein